MAKKTWAEKWGSSPVNYNRPPEALAKELKKIRTLTARRVKSLNKGKYFSYAAEAYNQNMKQLYINGKAPYIKDMSYQQIEKELRVHHGFWEAKTSTSLGAKSEIVNQSINFFGKTAKGKPVHIMTTDEAREAWKLFNEFYNMYKESTAKYDSFRLQTMIGAAMKDTYFNPDDFSGELQKIHAMMEMDFEQPFENEEEIQKATEIYHSFDYNSFVKGFKF